MRQTEYVKRRDVVFDYDEGGNVIGITIEHASQRADLSSFSVTKIPALAA